MEGIDKTSLKLLCRAVWGFHKEIATEVGVEQTYVSKVLNGHAVNMKIIAAAIKVRDREAKKQAQVMAKV